MSQYTLTAELGSVTSTRTFEQINDAAATFEAIHFIMDEANTHQSGPWAKGRIVLMDPRGRILQEMDAK
jgi:hypothetical protein